MNWWIPVQQCRTSCTRQPHLLSKSSSSRPRHGASTTYSTRSVAGHLASWKTFSGLLIIVVGSEIVNILIEETLDFAVVPSKEMGPDNNGRLK
uniref:Uncharacterized protein n=1 Tax=Salix viminalis TaxID=40686 RepID=A0A6N2N6V9_SALVM